MRRVLLLLGATVALAAAAAPSAGAAVVQLDGAPLNVFSDGLGRMQARYDGQTAGAFFDPVSNSPTAGLEILEGATSYPLGQGRTAISGPTLGTDAAGAQTLTSVYRVGPDLEVTETLSYADGTRRFTARYAVKNVAAVPVSFHAGALADVNNGGDLGTGTLDNGPPRAVGTASVPGGVLTQLVEGTPWTSYRTGNRTAMFNAFRAGSLQNVVDASAQDSGIGVEWDVAGLAPAATRTLEVGVDVGEHVATRTVTTTDDHNDQVCSAQDCTLREAFQDPGAGEVVVLPAGRYVLNAPLTLFRALAVRGAGAGRTIIDGNNAGRVIEIDNAGALDLSGVTVTGGRTLSGPGGGIYNTVGDGTPGVLTLRDSVVSGNIAVGNGGGISSAGATTILNSTIVGNSVAGSPSNGGGTGGGVAATQGTLRVAATTISANATPGTGAGLVVSAGVPTTIQSATIAGNTSTGGGSLAGGLALGNGAGATVVNTIIAGNLPADCAFGATAALTSAYALAGDGSCRLAGTGDQQGVDPQLGALADNGGPTPTRLPAAAGPAIDRGSPTGCLPADQRGQGRPQGGACDVGAVEIVPAPARPADPVITPPVTPPGGGGGPVTGTGALPPPVVGKSANLRRTEGTVLIKLPGSKSFIKLTADTQVPVGTIIDATKGRVSLSVSDGHGGISTAVFYGGIFRFTQTTGAKPLATMTLVGAKPSCAKAGKAKRSASAAAKKKKKPSSRHLWGDGKGNFQTKGQYSSATVRGTKWLVQDSCAGTTTRVARGVVAVRDFVKKKTVLVKAGRSYLARPKKK